MYDANEKKAFKMYVALMWTISDFLGLGNLSGWNTYSGRACLTCNLDAETNRLTCNQKWYFMGCRWRMCMSSLVRCKRFVGKRARGQQIALQDESPWKKRSIFFELPYWENNLLCHNFDVMHIEKNVCDNIVYTILNDSDKSKDHLKARKDLQLMKIRCDLWSRKDGKYSTAIFSMSNSQKDIFLRTLKNVVSLDSHSSNISRCIDLNQQKLSGLKSHDCHTLMEHLLPIASRNALPAQSNNLTHISCSQRYLCRVKQYVRYRAQPEGLIAESYLSDEILTFCSRYWDNVESKINRPMRVDDGLSKDVTNNVTSMFSLIGRAVEAAAFLNLSQTERRQAHRHVLVNCTAVENFLEASTKRRLRSIGRRNESHINKVVHREFTEWFKHEIPLGNTMDSREMQWLACDPNIQARRFKAYNVNRFMFKTLPREDGMRTQNSGVCVTSDTRSYASAHDSNVAVGGVSYYGRLVDIIELNYSGQITVVLFRCLWADTMPGRGIKQDVLGHTYVNFSNPIHTCDREDDESYILLSEACLVYYVEDEVDKEWSVVVHVKSRELFDMGEYNEHCEVELFLQPSLTDLSECDVEGMSLTRVGDLEVPMIGAIDIGEEAADL
ncbi:uncharacterized protein LOC107627126 [Arachis ipaensis]|uniref:uncharacterized protein LOC107627126 n=1 Tax=Arachis ipaensis TaxID=130454 RepID=UPI0007AF3215|nr:uncharacterized protein LOC107627126 [Arachis ipaensis]XP_025635854.1 uncharacterized protein LOC112729942 [Arachis hypogaea]